MAGRSEIGRRFGGGSQYFGDDGGEVGSVGGVRRASEAFAWEVRIMEVEELVKGLVGRVEELERLVVTPCVAPVPAGEVSVSGQKPWEALGITERTYYRRKKGGKG